MRQIKMQVCVPVDLDLWVGDPDDPEEGLGWQVKRAQLSAFADVSASAVNQSLGDDDYDELDRLANKTEDL